MTVCTLEDYRGATGDRVSLDADVLTALDAAQRRVEDLLERKLDDGEHTESLPVDDDGMVWPAGFPVAAVTVPADATVQPDGFAVKVTSSPVGGLNPVQAWQWLTGSPDPAPAAGQRPALLVTYTGGPGIDTDQELKDIICEVAARRLRPANTVGVPAGAQAVAMGGTASQSYSGRMLGGSASLPPEICAALHPHMHPHSRRMD